MSYFGIKMDRTYELIIWMMKNKEKSGMTEGCLASAIDGQ